MKIVNLGQVMDLERGGQFVNQFTVELPDGRRVAVNTNESTLQVLIQLAVGATPQDVEEMKQRVADQIMEQMHTGPSHGVAAPQEAIPEEELASIFGGDVGGPEPDLTPELGRVAEEETAPAPPRGGLGSGQPVRRPMVDKDGFALPVPSRTVEKDEMGYPITTRRAAPSGDDGSDDGNQI